MSDAHHDFKGGHELEAINSGILFKWVVGLTVITLFCCLAVVQWTYDQRDGMLIQRADEDRVLLKAHHDEMAALTKGMQRTLKDVAKDPALLEAGDPPAGWIHPDDIKKK